MHLLLQLHAVDKINLFLFLFLCYYTDRRVERQRRWPEALFRHLALNYVTIVEIKDAKWFLYIRIPLYPSISIFAAIQSMTGIFISRNLQSSVLKENKYFNVFAEIFFKAKFETYLSRMSRII